MVSFILFLIKLFTYLNNRLHYNPLGQEIQYLERNGMFDWQVQNIPISLNQFIVPFYKKKTDSYSPYFLQQVT